MANIFLCTFTNGFRIYLISRFMHRFFSKITVSNIREFAICSVYWILNTVLYLKFHLIWMNVLINLTGIIFMTYLYTKEIKMICFVTGSIYLVNMGCDIISVMIFSDYQVGVIFNQIYEIITVFLLFICELIIERLISKKNNEKKEINNLALLVVPICSIILLWIVTHNYFEIDSICAIIAGSMLIINFVVFYLYNLIINSFVEKYENEILKQQIKSDSNRLKIVLQTEDRIKMLRHDMKHHMNELKILANHNQVEKIQEYIDQMDEFLQNPNDVISSGNIEIDNLLNFMLDKAKKEKLNIEYDIKIMEPITYHFDINIILGNLLENAMEAAHQTKEKVIYVFIQLKQGVLKIEIKNSYNNQIVRNGKDFLTTKYDKNSHGIGINSVKKIVEKYNGVLDISYNENLFQTKVILYMTTIKK